MQRIRRELVIKVVNQVYLTRCQFEHSGGPETRDPSPQKSHVDVSSDLSHARFHKNGSGLFDRMYKLHTLTVKLTVKLTVLYGLRRGAL